MGTDLAGALAGGTVGLIGGPAGALGGAAVGVAVQRAARAALGRLRTRERERVGAAIALIAADTQDRRQRGEEPRDDGFFDESGGLRADAVEILEGLLRQAAATTEERKLPYLAHFYDGVAHDATVAASDVQFLLRVLDQLTYRQLAVLAVFGTDRWFKPLARAHGLRLEGRVDPSAAVLLEIDDLGSRGLLGSGSAERTRTYDDIAGRGASDAPYGTIRLSPQGAVLARLARLDEIPESEQQKVLEELRRRAGPGLAAH